MNRIQTILLSSSVVFSTLGHAFAADVAPVTSFTKQGTTQVAGRPKVWVAGMDVLNAATSSESLDAFRLGQISKDRETLQDAVLASIKSNLNDPKEVTARKKILGQLLNDPTETFDNKTYLNYWFNRSLLFTPWGKSTLMHLPWETLRKGEILDLFNLGTVGSFDDTSVIIGSAELNYAMAKVQGQNILVIPTGVLGIETFNNAYLKGIYICSAPTNGSKTVHAGQIDSAADIFVHDLLHCGLAEKIGCDQQLKSAFDKMYADGKVEQKDHVAFFTLFHELTAVTYGQKTIADLLNKVQKVKKSVEALPENTPYVPYDFSYNNVYQAISALAVQDGKIQISPEGQQRLLGVILAKASDADRLLIIQKVMALQVAKQSQDAGAVYGLELELTSIIVRYVSAEETLEQLGITFDQIDEVATAEAERILDVKTPERQQAIKAAEEKGEVMYKIEDVQKVSDTLTVRHDMRVVTPKANYDNEHDKQKLLALVDPKFKGEQKTLKEFTLATYEMLADFLQKMLAVLAQNSEDESSQLKRARSPVDEAPSATKGHRTEIQ